MHKHKGLKLNQIEIDTTITIYKWGWSRKTRIVMAVAPRESHSRRTPSALRGCFPLLLAEAEAPFPFLPTLQFFIRPYSPPRDG